MEKKYQKLVKILDENNLTKISYKEKDKEYSIERTSSIIAPQPLAKQSQDVKKLDHDPNHTLVKAPMLGLFYEASSPEAKPFVKKGSKVKKGQVLFILEVMKVLNEVKSPCDGVIVEIKVKNGQLVQFNDVVMVIE